MLDLLCVFPSPDLCEEADKTQGCGEAGEEDRKPRRKAYVHKPFLYSRYYSDSDDEVTVEERRRSAVSPTASTLKPKVFMVLVFNSLFLSPLSLSVLNCVLTGEGQRGKAA